ncbi:MAG TPA: ATP-grasp domain-containing protein [Xanthobacteraceae bacterium]
MAKLLEYEAKRLLQAAGIATPSGKPAASVREALAIAEEIGYPVALKAQVPAGGRGKAGGIAFAGDARELAERAGALFGHTIQRHAVRSLLVERRLAIEAEHYLAVLSNPAARAPTVIFARKGGIDVEDTARDDAVSCDVDLTVGFRLHHALDLIRRAGISGRVLVALAQVAVRLFEVYRRNDCMLAEINPLAMTAQGPVAADARFDLDDDALFRHPDFTSEEAGDVGARTRTPLESIAARIDANDHRGSAHFIQIDPTGALAASEGRVSIGFDGVGTGVSLTTLDELVPLGFLPKNFCDTSGNPTASKLYRITRVILAQPDIEGYVFISCLSSQQLDNTARGIVKAFKEVFPGGQPNIPCVLCFRGAWDETALALFDEHGIADSPWVRLMGRDTTEREVASAFRDLHARWRSREIAA